VEPGSGGRLHTSHLPKGGDTWDCSNYRPVPLLPVDDKLFAKLHSKRISRAVCLPDKNHICISSRQRNSQPVADCTQANKVTNACFFYAAKAYESAPYALRMGVQITARQHVNGACVIPVLGARPTASPRHKFLLTKNCASRSFASSQQRCCVPYYSMHSSAYRSWRLLQYTRTEETLTSCKVQSTVGRNFRLCFAWPEPASYGVSETSSACMRNGNPRPPWSSEAPSAYPSCCTPCAGTQCLHCTHPPPGACHAMVVCKAAARRHTTAPVRRMCGACAREVSSAWYVPCMLAVRHGGAATKTKQRAGAAPVSPPTSPCVVFMWSSQFLTFAVISHQLKFRNVHYQKQSGAGELTQTSWADNTSATSASAGSSIVHGLFKTGWSLSGAIDLGILSWISLTAHDMGNLKPSRDCSRSWRAHQHNKLFTITFTFTWLQLSLQSRFRRFRLVHVPATDWQQCSTGLMHLNVNQLYYK